MEKEATQNETTAAEKRENLNIYIGNLRTRVKKKDQSKFLSGTICIEDFYNIPEKYIQVGNNGKRYARIVIEKKFVVDKYNNTHSVKVDTFIPDPNFNNPKKDEGDDFI